MVFAERKGAKGTCSKGSSSLVPVLVPFHVGNERLQQPLLCARLLYDPLCCLEQLLRIMQCITHALSRICQVIRLVHVTAERLTIALTIALTGARSAAVMLMMRTVLLACCEGTDIVTAAWRSWGHRGTFFNQNTVLVGGGV